MSATRVFRRQRESVLAVRRARLKVVRGPDKGAQLELAEAESVLLGSDPDADLVLNDDTVSARHAELKPTVRGWVVRDLGSTNGVVVGDLRVMEALLDDKRRLVLGETELEWRLLDGEAEHALSEGGFGTLIGESPAMRTLFGRLEQAAGSDSTVLLEGESGTGKEVIAQALHHASQRNEGPFVVVDCGALASGIIDSELFGHERGAFTGADRARSGALEEASGGTLFLDEIGELPLEHQTKLLRALEAREVRRVGSSKPRPIDVRVIAATHRKLERQVQAGQFRADLYYRLAVLRLHVPSLRDRREDVLPLARHFVQRFRPGQDPDPILGGGLATALGSYDWPGNVRELRNVIERLCLLGELDTRLREQAPPAPYAQAREEAIDRFEREYCRALLAHSDGVVARAAERAGISRQMLHRILRKHELRGE
jgi:DNA-binding NtrC family response regulator